MYCAAVLTVPTTTDVTLRQCQQHTECDNNNNMLPIPLQAFTLHLMPFGVVL